MFLLMLLSKKCLVMSTQLHRVSLGKSSICTFRSSFAMVVAKYCNDCCGVYDMAQCHVTCIVAFSLNGRVRLLARINITA